MTKQEFVLRYVLAIKSRRDVGHLENVIMTAIDIWQSVYLATGKDPDEEEDG